MFNMLTELIVQGTIPRLLEGKMLVSTVLWFFAIFFWFFVGKLFLNLFSFPYIFF